MNPLLENVSRKIRAWAGVLGVLGLGASALAQEAAPTPPEGPLLKAAPNYSRWNISYALPKDARNAPSLPPGSPHRATVSKTQNILHEEIFDGRGCCTDTWYLGAQQYRKPHGASAWYLSEPALSNNAQDSTYDPLPASGFRDWDWVSKETYVGTVDFEGRACLAFVPGGMAKIGSVADAEKLQERLAAQSHVAYVDAQSRLPVVQKMGPVLLSYRFENLPPNLLTLPPELAAQIRKTEEARARLLQPAARPY